ncbi:MAG: Rossmann-like and DUF2520 domain-containing protein [Actinomycetales bacterium]
MLTGAPPRLRVSVIGAGRVGAVFGAALARSGHSVVAVTAISEMSRLRAQALLPNVPITDVPTAVQAADLVVLAVPDDVLAELVTGLAETGLVRDGQFWCPPAGAPGIEVLAPFTQQGAIPLAIHPVMTFTGTSIDLARLADCPFGVTAPEGYRSVAEALVVEMGGEPIWVPEQARARYHAALALGANGLVTLVNAALDLLRESGVADARRLIEPLLQASLENALRLGDQALTGPVARGDAATVAAHLETIAQVQLEVAQAYRAMARLTALRAVDSGLLPATAAESLLDVLARDSTDGRS